MCLNGTCVKTICRSINVKSKRHAHAENEMIRRNEQKYDTCVAITIRMPAMFGSAGFAKVLYKKTFINFL